MREWDGAAGLKALSANGDRPYLRQGLYHSRGNHRFLPFIAEKWEQTPRFWDFTWQDRGLQIP
jgi:hypothetical protein